MHIKEKQKNLQFSKFSQDRESTLVYVADPVSL